MTRLKDWPIRRKLVLFILMTSVVAMLLMRGTFLVYEYLTFKQAAERQISALGQVIASNSTAALAFENQDDAAEILAALEAAPDIVTACLYDRNGGLFAAFPRHAPAGACPPVGKADGYRFEHSSLGGFRPVVQRGRRLGTFYLEMDTAPILREWLVVSVAISLAVVVLILLVTWLLSRALQRQISQPILALAATARAISEQRDYSIRAARYGHDELGGLTDAFNQMVTEIERLHLNLEQRVDQRTAQLEAANRELESFSYSVSHDLRAPLRHIDGFSALLEKRIGDQLDPQGHRYLDAITQSARHLGRLIDDLLSFARMGRAELCRARASTQALVDEVLQSLQPETQGRQIEWRVGPLPDVEADPSLLRQVWFNLLHNAVKYTRGREPAIIEVSHGGSGDGEHLFCVRDNGAGFDMKYADKLFGVFQRLHHSSEFEGTGIGLANVRRIVLRHGGRIWAESVVGAGAAFYFGLPVTASGGELAPASSAGSSATSASAEGPRGG